MAAPLQAAQPQLVKKVKRGPQHNIHTQKIYAKSQERGQTEPGLVALYDIRLGNGAGLFLQLQSPHGTIAKFNRAAMPDGFSSGPVVFQPCCGPSFSAHEFSIAPG